MAEQMPGEQQDPRLEQQQPERPGQQGPAPEAAPDVDVSEQELHEFVDVVMLVQEIQGEYHQEMQARVEDEGMDIEKFDEIYQNMQMGERPEDMDITNEEMESFERANESLERLGEEIEQEVLAAMDEEGLDISVERYQEINMAIQQDPQLQQQVQQILQEQMGVPPQPQGGQQPQQPQQPPQN